MRCQVVEKDAFEQLRMTLAAEARAAGSLPGSVLAELVRRVLGPDFQPHSVGAKNFKEFVSKHIPELVEVGRAGMDVLYGCHPRVVTGVASPTSDVGQPRQDPWRLWSNPNSQLALRATADGALEAISLDNVSGDRDLSPTTSTQHREIGRQFLEKAGVNIADEQLRLLREALKADEKIWFWRWMNAARMVPIVNRQWMVFRGEQLASLLNDVVSKLSISDVAKQRVAATMLQHRMRKGGKSAAARRRPEGTLRSSKLRRIVEDAVAQMSDEDLRRVWLPVGALVDALGRPR